ncbi:MAG: HAMP domain-containing sensor histidine kinase, partial [bacterium]|nr:HAMP domain-containing sensor histidine kinase [bacterium]
QLRAPLTAIKGYLSMLMEGTYGAVGEEQKRPMHNVYDSNERMIKLVNDLLNISRIESGRVEVKLEEGSIEEILEGVVQELQVKAHEKRLDLVVEKPTSPLPLFRFDKEKIRNIVLNLVDNAIHYTEQGSVSLNAKVQIIHNKNTMVIQVKDTGLGMSQEEIARLFQSFTRGETGNRAWAEGSGLGLYIAKQFVALHKGKISAESKGANQGSTFIVELPLA